MSDFQHTMVVGGTGMLFDLSVELARRSDVLTSIALAEDSLARLSAALAPGSGRHHAVAVDYTRTEAFTAAVAESIRLNGPVALAVGWFRDDGAAFAFARALGEQQAPVRFFHVLGSTAADPEASLARVRPPFEDLRRISYHSVILGFVPGEGGSRWLSHAEICAGVREAIARSSREHVVGSVRPWSSRPHTSS